MHGIFVASCSEMRIRMNIYVTVDENWAIGKGDAQLAQIPGNQRYFQGLTGGKTVVVGRKTLQAMPQGQPLYGREYMVLSQNPAYRVKGADVFADADALLLAAKEAEAAGREGFVCGGESVYRQFLPYCDAAYVTLIEKSYDADQHFPNLDRDEEWELSEESEEQTCFDITYYFRKYTRRK